MKRLFVAGFVMLVALSGCSDDPKPKFAEPSESVSPDAIPTQPPATDVPTDRTPTQTVRDWVKANNEALRTGDTQAMVRLSAPECRGCLNYVEPIEQVYQDGGSFDTAGWQILESRVRESARAATVDAAIRIAGGRTTRRAGDDASSYPAEERLMSFELVKDGRQWLINLIVVVR